MHWSLFFPQHVLCQPAVTNKECQVSAASNGQKCAPFRVDEYVSLHSPCPSRSSRKANFSWERICCRGNHPHKQRISFFCSCSMCKARSVDNLSGVPAIVYMLCPQLLHGRGYADVLSGPTCLSALVPPRAHSDGATCKAETRGCSTRHGIYFYPLAVENLRTVGVVNLPSWRGKKSNQM